MNKYLWFVVCIFCIGMLAGCGDDADDETAKNDNSTDVDGDGHLDDSTDEDSTEEENTKADSTDDESTEAENTKADSTDDESTENNVNPETEETLVSISQCYQFCELEMSCYEYSDMMFTDVDDCQDGCDAMIPLYNCVFSLVDEHCRKTYKSFYQCAYSMTTCDEFSSYLEGVVEISDEPDPETAKAYRCGQEYYEMETQCKEALESEIEKEPTSCKDETEVFQAYIDELNLKIDSNL